MLVRVKHLTEDQKYAFRIQNLKLCVDSEDEGNRDHDAFHLVSALAAVLSATEETKKEERQSEPDAVADAVKQKAVPGDLCGLCRRDLARMADGSMSCTHCTDRDNSQ